MLLLEWLDCLPPCLKSHGHSRQCAHAQLAVLATQLTLGVPGLGMLSLFTLLGEIGPTSMGCKENAAYLGGSFCQHPWPSNTINGP